MSASHTVASIDIGTHQTRVVVCEVDPNQTSPRIIATGESPSYGIRHGYIMNRYDTIKSVKQALRMAEQAGGLKIKEVFLALGGIGLSSEVISASVNLPENSPVVSDFDISRAIEASERNLLNHVKNIKVIERIPLRYALDGKTVLGKPLGMTGKRLTVTTLFITYLEHHLEDLIQVVNDAGVDVVDVVPAPVAASLVAVEPKQKMAGCAFLDIGAETLSLAVFENTLLVSLKVFPIGSADITNDIALGFQVSLDEAEHIKRNQADTKNNISQREQLEEIVSARLVDIFEITDRHLESIHRSGMLPAGIVLSGGGSHLENLEPYARETLKLPVTISVPEKTKAGQRNLKSSSWYVAYGSCLYALEYNTYRSRGPGIKQALDRVRGFFRQLMP